MDQFTTVVEVQFMLYWRFVSSQFVFFLQPRQVNSIDPFRLSIICGHGIYHFYCKRGGGESLKIFKRVGL